MSRSYFQNGSKSKAARFLSLAFIWAFAVPATAQVDPAEFGFRIPAGEITPGDGRRIVAKSEAGKEIVCKVHVQVGDSHIAMLPDGQLVAVAPGAKLTALPFVPAAKDEIGKQLTKGRFAGFKTKTNLRYVFVYNTTDGFAETASKIMESMYNGVLIHAGAKKIETHNPEVPLVVIMFRTEAEFQAHRRMPPGVVAYYNTISNHVVMYEESRIKPRDPNLAKLGFQQKLATIAHEGAHQILHNIGVQKRLSVWPMWLSEGLAEYFAPTTLGENMRWKGAGEVNDMRMFELESYLKSKKDGLDGKTIEQTVMAARLTSTGYASAWSLTHYLARNRATRAKFNTFVKEMSELGPLEGERRVERPGIIRENARQFKEHFGQDLASMEKQLVRHLEGLQYTSPVAGYPHYLAMIILPDGNRPFPRARAFHTMDLAQKWIADVVSQVPEDKQGNVQSKIQKCKNRNEAVLYKTSWLRQF